MSANPALPQQVLDALDALSGLHPGSRPVHAKGLMCAGTFTPAPEAVQLTRAPHASRPSTPVTVRYSNASGVPASLDNDPQSGPRRNRGPLPPGQPRPHRYHRPFLRRLSGPQWRGVPRVRARRGRVRRRQARSIGRLSRRASARKAVRCDAKARPDQFRAGGIFRGNVVQVHQCPGLEPTRAAPHPAHGGTEYLSTEEAAAKSGNFLFEEIAARLASGPFGLGVFVQMAEPGDDVTDASVTWPASREEVPFGTVIVTARLDEQVPERRKVIFDPVPRVDGIELSGDPLTEIRSDLYLLSGRRRRRADGF